MEKPNTVVWGVNLLWVSLAIGIIASLFDPAKIMHAAQQVPTLTVVLLLSMLVIVLGATAALNYLVSVGKNWARIVLLFWIVIAACFSVYGLPDLFKTSRIAAVTNVLQTVMQLAAIIFVFTKSAEPWFKRKA